MSPLSQRLKDAADALAQSALSPEGGQILGQLRQLLSVAAEECEAVSPAVPEMPCPIGIWEPEKCAAGYRFVRPAVPREQASLWASVAAIEAKGRHRRVVLIGESVARGFFFDPHFNPAMVLQHILRSASRDDDVDVIDLGRTDLTMGPLLELTQAAMQLAPDAVVILAGNNWQPTVGLPWPHFHDLADRLRRGDWADVKAHLDGLLRERTRATIEALQRLAAAHRFKLIFVLPEFNLLDWRTDTLEPPLLDAAATVEWHQLRAAGEAALDSGDAAAALALGLRLIALDRGTTPVGHNLVAATRLLAGATAEARKSLEAARDCAICWPSGPESPRCFTAIQEVARDEAARNRLLLIDLPRVFQDHQRGGLPDRRLFMDYCHFNVTATHLAMAAVAQAVLASVYRLQRPLRELCSIRVAVASDVEGEAHFLAAVHNANWGQPAELVRWHCDRALELAPGLRRLLLLFLDFHVRRTPPSLCRSFEEFCRLGGVSAVSLLFDSARPTADRFLNPTLIGAITASLDARQPPGLGARPAVEDLLCAEHSIEVRAVDLLDRSYSGESYLSPLSPTSRTYYRASHRISRFRMVCKESQALRLILTYRTRWCAAGQPVRVRIENRKVEQVPGSATWATVTLAVPAEVLRPGINTIEIHWPAPGWQLASWKGRAIKELENAQLADVSPVYGEIHAFRIAVPGGDRSEARFVVPE